MTLSGQATDSVCLIQQISTWASAASVISTVIIQQSQRNIESKQCVNTEMSFTLPATVV